MFQWAALTSNLLCPHSASLVGVELFTGGGLVRIEGVRQRAHFACFWAELVKLYITLVVWRYWFSRNAIDWRSWAAFGVRGSSGPVRRADHPINPMATRTQRSQRRRRSHTVRREARTRTRSIARVQLANGRAYAGVRRVPALPPLAPEPSYPPLRAYLPIFLVQDRPTASGLPGTPLIPVYTSSRYGTILVYAGIYRGRFLYPVFRRL